MAKAFWGIGRHIFVLTVITGVLDAHRCPGPEWIPRPGTSSCYLIKTGIRNDQRLPWEEARQDCLVRGGALVSFEDDEELEYVGKLADTSAQAYWVGLSYGSGTWEWADTNQSFTVEKFSSFGENTFGSSMDSYSRKRHRGYLKRTNGRLTLNTTLAKRFSWICKGRHSTQPRCKTEEGWDYMFGRCLQYHPVHQTWSQAQEICRAAGSIIAVPQSLQESKGIASWGMGLADSNRVWLGFQINKQAVGAVDQSIVAFENGQSLATSDKTTFFSKNLTRTLSQLTVGVHHGVIYGGWSSDAGKWILESEDSMELPFACATEKEKCPYGWNELDGQCYQVHGTQSDVRSWNEANQFCSNQGGHLAFVTSQRIQNLLTTRLSENRSSKISDLDADSNKNDDEIAEDTPQENLYWIGYRSTTSGSTFLWTSNEAASFTALSTDYSNWKSDQSLCASVNSDTGKWQMNHCSDKLRVICQADHLSAVYEDIIYTV